MIEMEQSQTTGSKPNIERILGYILLTPPLLGALLFTLSVFDYFDTRTFLGGIVELKNLGVDWTGTYGSGGGGYMSAAPIYLGLMAIAGAYLIKGTTNK